ncbi:MAG: Short-chain dehydrogenase/reductase [Actinomycetia bacterium]|nr:Short-chain dehydrogenase/reductase [Actinomycetes bacterium]
MEPIRYGGDVVVVTGAGRGIGRAHALDIAGRGARLVVNDVDGDAADSVVAEIEAAGGIAAASHESVTTPDGGAAIIATAVDRYGTVDAVVNNAAIVRSGYLEDLTADDIDSVLDVAVRGAFFVTQPAWRIMKAKGYGRVVFTSSGTGMFGHQGAANYAAAKAALYGLAKALAFEGAERGIRVNVLLPLAYTAIGADQPIPDYARYRAVHIPAGTDVDAPERATPAMNAHVVAYLASRACAVNGEAIDVCRGRYGRLFVGVTDGWLPADAVTVDAEAIGDHLDEIRDLTGFTVPTSYYDEMAGVTRRLRDLD